MMKASAKRQREDSDQRGEVNTRGRKEENEKKKDCTDGDVGTIDHDSGVGEIDNLFAGKKEAKKESKVKAENDALAAKKARKSGKGKFPGGGDGGGRNVKAIGNLKYDRSDASRLVSGEWASDGLGGVFNSDGFTGRRDGDNGMKVFKAHLFNKPGFGESKDCPFDCDCCFI